MVCGRGTYEAAEHWGDKNPWGLPFFIVTHRPEEEPEGGEFTFVAAEGKDVHVMGGAETIRQALDAGMVDELTIIIGPVVLGGGKRLEHLGVRQSPFATFVEYRVKAGPSVAHRGPPGATIDHRSRETAVSHE